MYEKEMVFNFVSISNLSSLGPSWSSKALRSIHCRKQSILPASRWTPWMKFEISSEIRGWSSASTRSPDNQIGAYSKRDMCDLKFWNEIKKSCCWEHEYTSPVSLIAINIYQCWICSVLITRRALSGLYASGGVTNLAAIQLPADLKY